MMQKGRDASRCPLRAVALLCSVAAASCAGPRGPGEIDLSGPRLTGSDLPDHAVSPTPVIALRFSEAIDERTITASTVAMVPHRLAGPCTVDLACADGRCHRGVCQHRPDIKAWLDDASRPPLTARRLAEAVPLQRVVDEQQVTVEPLVPLTPHRLHTLVVARAVTDRRGNRLVGGPGELALDFATGGPELARPTVELLSPAAGATEIPTNLDRVVVRFSRRVGGVDARTLRLEVDGRRVAAWIKLDSPLCSVADDSCLVLRLAADLPALSEVRLRGSGEIRDLDGRRLMVTDAERFATGDGPDHRAPAVPHLAVEIADRCLVARVMTDEPVDLLLRARWSGGSEQRAAIGAARHEVGFVLPHAVDRVEGTVELFDLAGNPLRMSLPAQRVPPDLPRVVISEVLANPAGPEPAQELVELANLSTLAVGLGGWTIDDGDDGVGRRTLPAVTLAAGQLAVVVGSRFAVGANGDPPPAADAALVRLDGTLGQLGLSNRGERVTLRDPLGRLVSSYGGYHGLEGRSGDGVSVERVDLDQCDVAGNWRLHPGGGSSPGWRP